MFLLLFFDLTLESKRLNIRKNLARHPFFENLNEGPASGDEILNKKFHFVPVVVVNHGVVVEVIDVVDIVIVVVVVVVLRKMKKKFFP